VVVPDTSKDTRFFSQVDEKTKTETHQSLQCREIPRHLSGRDRADQLHGPDGFDARDLKLLEALSDSRRLLWKMRGT